MGTTLILIPTYNREAFLDYCLNEYTKQTSKDFEIVVYDDASTDNTEQVVKSYGHHYIKGDTNKGVGYARNRLFDYADTREVKYLMWQDSDDVPAPRRVENMVKAIETQSVDMLFSEMWWFNGEKHTATRTKHQIDVTKYTNRKGLHNNMNFATGIFKAELTEYRFDETLRRNEDGKWLSDLIDADKTFGYFESPLYYCRRHDNRLTTLHAKGLL